MNIDLTNYSELSQLRDLADAQQKLIAILIEDKEMMLEALCALDAVIDLDQADDPVDALAVQLWIANATELKEACHKARIAIARAEGRAS